MSEKYLKKAIWEVIKNRMNHFSWRCGQCEKILECEEQDAPTRGIMQGETRYCESLIKAAIFDNESFTVSFPLNWSPKAKERNG